MSTTNFYLEIRNHFNQTDLERQRRQTELEEQLAEEFGLDLDSNNYDTEFDYDL